MEVTTIGIDIAKRIFQVHGVDKKGKTVLKKKLMRDQVLIFMANLAKCLVGIEACGGTNHWAREITKLGHIKLTSGCLFIKILQVTLSISIASMLLTCFTFSGI